MQPSSSITGTSNINPPTKRKRDDTNAGPSNKRARHECSINEIPPEILDHIFSQLSSKDIIPNLPLVSTQWHTIGLQRVAKNYQNAIFDLTRWTSFLGEKAPTSEELQTAWSLLPENIKQMLISICPIYPDKWVQDTHVLIYLTASISNKIINLISMGKSLEKHLPTNPQRILGYDCNQRTWEQQFKSGEFDLEINKPHWVLMTKTILQDSFGKDYDSQKKMLNTLGLATGFNYKFPKTAAAIACMIAQLTVTEELPFTTGLTRCEDSANAFQRNVVGNMQAIYLHPSYCKDGVFLATNSNDAISYIGVAPAFNLNE